MDEKKLEKVAVRELLPTDGQILFLVQAAEAVKATASERHMMPIACLREIVLVSEIGIEQITQELIEGPANSSKEVIAICDRMNWSIRTGVSELRNRALAVLKERAAGLEDTLRGEQGTGHKTVRQIANDASECAKTISSQGIGWPCGSLGI